MKLDPSLEIFRPEIEGKVAVVTGGSTGIGSETVKTLAALGMQSSGSTGDGGGGDLDLLARLISAEARGEPYEGQVAVGAVVLNRVEHPSFPNSIAGVIYQPGAFSCLDDGQFNEPVPCAPRATRSTARTPPAARSTISTPPPPPASGSGRAR